MRAEKRRMLALKMKEAATAKKTTKPEPATDSKEKEVVKETEKPKKASQKASKTTKSKKSE